MSQKTRCPACQTLFKVVPDQLRVSEGWVRCGQCSEIFDAALHLYPEPQFASPAEEIPHTPTAPTAVITVIAVDPVDREPAVLQPVAPPALPGSIGIEDIAQEPLAHETPTVEPVTEKPVAKEVAAKEAVAAANAIAIAEDESTQLRLPDPPTAVSFLRGPQQESLWRKPSVRIALGLTALGLLAALALQVVVHERDRIAAHMPDVRPALAAACEVLHCQVLPLRQIESVVIDSSTFSKLRGDAFRLVFTVKNTSAVELAMPALELTLTDSQDQPAMRRVFLPSELGATSNTLSAGSEWTASVPVGVRPNAGGERINGYRILAFYP